MNTHPRKDYGTPLRLYSCINSTWRYVALPPRSDYARQRWQTIEGPWAGLRAPPLQGDTYIAALYSVLTTPGARLGQRITWAELPANVQRALRASEFGMYCPQEAPK